ncbi:MAG: response regulator [Flavobacterium sp.]
MRLTALNIVLADDDADDRLFFKEAFEEVKLKHRITEFPDGEKLINHLSDRANPMPDIIFLDLNMPRKSGMQCLQEIRANERLKDITVAIYSTSSTEEDIEDTFVAGANVYIKKPSNFGSLVNILNEVTLVNWQYIVDGLNKDSFILSL